MSVDVCGQATIAAITKGVCGLRQYLSNPLDEVRREDYADHGSWYQAWSKTQVSWDDPEAIGQALLDANVAAWEERYKECYEGDREFDGSYLERDYTLGEVFGAVRTYSVQMGEWLFHHPGSGIGRQVGRLTDRICELALATIGDPAIGPDSVGVHGQIDRSSVRGIVGISTLFDSPLVPEWDKWQGLHESYDRAVLSRRRWSKEPIARDLVMGHPSDEMLEAYEPGWHTYYALREPPYPGTLPMQGHIKAAFYWGEWVDVPIPMSDDVACGEVWYDRRLSRRQCEEHGLLEAPFLTRGGKVLAPHADDVINAAREGMAKGNADLGPAARPEQEGRHGMSR